MLAEQFRVWAGYPEDLKSQIEVLVVDDGSPEPAGDVPRPDGLPALRIGRLTDTADPMTPPWRQDACRNRAAHHAVGEWLFLTDMDHVLPADSLRALLGYISSGSDVVYMFDRLDAPHLKPKKDNRGERHPHPNSFAMRRDRYWMLGGYDEDLCGVYGTDGPFRRRVDALSRVEQLWDVPIIRYPREVIPDASTRTDREQFRNRGQVLRTISDKAMQKLGPVSLSIPWAPVYPETWA